MLSDIATVLRGTVRARLARTGLNTADAEDVVHEVLIGLHGKRHTWDDNRAFLSWLNAIAHHKLVDSVRRLQREARRRVDVKPEDWVDAFEADPVDLDRQIVDVDRHLDLLSATQRRVLHALAVEQISVTKAAGRFGMSDGGVRMILHRGLERISRLARGGAMHGLEDGE